MLFPLVHFSPLLFDYVLSSVGLSGSVIFFGSPVPSVLIFAVFVSVVYVLFFLLFSVGSVIISEI